MTVLADVHGEHDATFETRGGREVVAHYGKPERVHGAVRRGVGVIEHAVGVLAVTGGDRVEFVDNAVSNRVPAEDGRGVYALLLDPQGRVETDMYLFNAGERLLVFTPPGEADPLAEEWREKTFIQDVDVDVATDDFGVFGVHGPQATEKVASVLSEGTPESPLSFVRGSMGEAGVTVIRSDAPTGEEGYTVVCDAEAAADAFDSLENRGLNAPPFGYRTWETLTLEAGTPLFEAELDGEIPNVLGVRNAVDFEKGCFVGQEVVSRVENRGRPSRRLVGLAPGRVPEASAAVFAGDESVGAVTRAAESPTRGEPLALALVGFDTEGPLTVRVDGEEVEATREALPFVDGSERSARLPAYDSHADPA
jgi:aminomethyltransferase